MSDKIAVNIQRELKQVRKAFFPRWDRAKLWKCRTVRELDGACAKCVAESKTLKIAFSDNPTLLLIHEICHAVAGYGHSKKWQARMAKAAIDAERGGRPELAVQIREEIRGYQETPVTGKVAEIYGLIDDVLMDQPEATMMQAADWIRRDYCMNRKEFFDSYKRFKTEFAKKQRSWRKRLAQESAIREKWQKALDNRESMGN